MLWKVVWRWLRSPKFQFIISGRSLFKSGIILDMEVDGLNDLQLISVLSILIDSKRPVDSYQFSWFPLPPAFIFFVVFLSSSPIHLEVQHTFSTSSSSLLKTCPYHHTPFAYANLSTVSCKSNISIGCFAFFLSINLTLYIALTKLLSFRIKIVCFIFSKTPCFASIQHCWSHTTFINFSFYLQCEPSPS